MVATAASPVKPRASIARLEEAYDNRAFVIRQLRRARVCGEWVAVREWESELLGIEAEIASLKSALDVAY